MRVIIQGEREKNAEKKQVSLWNELYCLTTRVRHTEGSWLSSAIISRAIYIRFSSLTGSPQSMTMAWEWEKPPPHEMKTSHLQWQVWSTHGLVSTTSGVVPSKEDQTLGGACVLKKADLLLLQLTSASVSRGKKSSCHCLVPLSHSVYPMVLWLGRKSQKSGSPHWEPIEVIQSIQETYRNLSHPDLRGWDPSIRRPRTGSEQITTALKIQLHKGC